MKIFLDTANIDDIKSCLKLGLVDGVTTNPSLIAKEGVSMKDRIQEILKIVSGPVSVEVTTDQLDQMISQGLEYHSWHPNIYVKLPCTPTGVQALIALKKQDVKINMTLVFSLSQALICAKLGADFVSPFVGRLDDIGADGIEFVSNIKDTYTLYGYQTEVLAASIRSIDHVTSCISVAADICTIPVKIFNQLLAHPLTQKGQAKFLADFKSSTNA